MPKSEGKIKATARPALHENSTSPPSGGRKSARTLCRVNDEQSPGRYKTEDGISNAKESNAEVIDDVDHNTPHKSPKVYPELPQFDKSPKIYPDLPRFDLPDDNELSQSWSSPSKSGFCSPNDSYVSAHSHCHSRTGPQSLRKEVPVTPEKGSPGKKLYPEMTVRNPQQLSRSQVVLVIFIIGLILIVLSVYFHSKENIHQHTQLNSYIKPIKEVHEDFKRELRLLIRDFSQPRNFWLQLMAQIDSIMVESPTQPAVILAVVPEDARGTATCLLHKIASALMYAFEDSRFVMHDVSDAQQNPHLLKMELDHVLQGLSKTHAAVIHNIENIPGEAAMIFHAYCDNENAPYKQALLLPIIEVQGYYEDLAYERLDNTVDELLTKIWGRELQIKDVSAIISRVANAPVLIQPERNEKIKELCPI